MKKWLLVSGLLIVSSLGLAADPEKFSPAASEEFNGLKDKMERSMVELREQTRETLAQQRHDLARKLQELEEQLLAQGKSKQEIDLPFGEREKANRQEILASKAQLKIENGNKLKEWFKQHAPILVAEDPDFHKIDQIISVLVEAIEEAVHPY